MHCVYNKSVCRHFTTFLILQLISHYFQSFAQLPTFIRTPRILETTEYFDERLPDRVVLSLQKNPALKHHIESMQHPSFHSLAFLPISSNLSHAAEKL